MKKDLCQVFFYVLLCIKSSFPSSVRVFLPTGDLAFQVYFIGSPGSMSASKHNRRPPTIWVSEAPSLQAGSESCTTVSETSAVDRVFPKSFRTKEKTAALDTEKYRSSSGAVHEDPWSILEPIAYIKLDHPYVLARYKEDKGRLVQVRELELQAFSDLGLQRTLNRISHSSFRSLLGRYHHGDSVFLAWEHVEVSIIQILATKFVITASEIIAIVKPVSGVTYCITTRVIADYKKILEGIQYLAERGRVLATLTTNTIFLTQSGKVKIGTHIKLTPGFQPSD